VAAPRQRPFRWERTPFSGERAARADPLGAAGVSWRDVFGNDRPTEVEIGCGRGRFLVPAACVAPGRNFMGLERSQGLVSAAQAAIAAARIGNARVLCCDARCVITFLVADASVAAYHLYFPDPWWKRRHHKRRLLTPSFCAALARTLAPGGFLHLASDVPHLVDAFGLGLRAAGLTAGSPNAVPPTPFSERCLSAHRAVYSAAYERGRQMVSEAPKPGLFMR
jgi:tRNA (guanine-N7-)-methyltransferase